MVPAMLKWIVGNCCRQRTQPIKKKETKSYRNVDTSWSTHQLDMMQRTEMTSD